MLTQLINSCFNRWSLHINRVEVGRNVTINGRIYINNKGKLLIADNATINSGERYNPIGGQARTCLIVFPGGNLTIGKYVGISNSTIIAQTSVDIGEGTLIGASCNIWDTDFHSLDPAIRGTAADIGDSRPVSIGKNAFIGGHSILLKGVTIGDRVIVRAGSVVSRSIAADSLFK